MEDRVSGVSLDGGLSGGRHRGRRSSDRAAHRRDRAAAGAEEVVTAASSARSSAITCGAPLLTRNSPTPSPDTVASVRLVTGSNGTNRVTRCPSVAGPGAAASTARSIGSRSSAREVGAAAASRPGVLAPGAVHGVATASRFWVSVPVLSEHSTSLSPSSSTAGRCQCQCHQSQRQHDQVVADLQHRLLEMADRARRLHQCRGPAGIARRAGRVHQRVALAPEYDRAGVQHLPGSAGDPQRFPGQRRLVHLNHQAQVGGPYVPVP
jgi:hypothetical protein